METYTHLILNFTNTYTDVQETILWESLGGSRSTDSSGNPGSASEPSVGSGLTSEPSGFAPESSGLIPDGQEWEQSPGNAVLRLDLRDITGTDLYCDDIGRGEILARLSEYPPQGIHFLDSGNYHYLTHLFTSRLDRDYALLFYDHHTDMQPAAFDLLSCGSWAKESLERDPHLKRLVCVGPPEESLLQIPKELQMDPRLVCISEAEFLEEPEQVATALGTDLPVYLSIDKDILRREDCATNWDQGKVPLDFLCRHLSTILPGQKLLGCDICGLLPESDPAFRDGCRELQVGSDRELLRTLV